MIINKVKLIFSPLPIKFQNEVNKFIKNKKIIDIKYQSQPTFYSALIIYKEGEDNEDTN